ncbi:hypothetical protein FOXG_21937 [Fusarium oxysporum f. sp. lycopersici 4287]|uniref:Uncharacterized protein n=1 Tax=Fusarium oxysporum f. sp. lycopersici (strain 4287 / CBS 123668 / FGSC 9935 / NRRL 34936) TaxID=426428 RepID=A0A0J9W3K7_FUSO4|nr:hypothetical protein FOXG_21937 [Fusarium oxysporum f. sp. lycopersici 4287]KNB17465.1 hypothetical protein FOXG_21937 [Fusarium oxysporum f. sp. lycopersici 4287]
MVFYKHMAAKAQGGLMELKSFIISALSMVRRRELRHAPDRIGMLLPKHLPSENPCTTIHWFPLSPPPSIVQKIRYSLKQSRCLNLHPAHLRPLPHSYSMFHVLLASCP